MTVTNMEQSAYTLESLRNKKGFICDMDGVIYHGNLLLPGVREFVDFLKRENKKFLFLPIPANARQRNCSKSWSAWAWRWMKNTSIQAR